MSHLHRSTVIALLLLVGGLASDRSEGQVLAKTLLFNTVKPCRVADTRSATAGMLIGGVARTFNIVGPTTNYSAQGGVAGGCGIPGFAGGRPQVQAVAINLVAVSPSGEGFLTAWPSDQSFPGVSTVNFQKLTPNLNIANGVIVPVRQDVQGGDITIVAGVANAHVIVDIVGYFTKAEPRKYYLTQNPVTGGGALTACASGYHMAALSEIFDPANLAYNTALGATVTDSGSGLTNAAGWIRTGNSSNAGFGPGTGNCSVWTSSLSADGGTAVAFAGAFWTDAASLVSPWVAFGLNCNRPLPVWCVEN